MSGELGMEYGVASGCEPSWDILVLSDVRYS